MIANERCERERKNLQASIFADFVSGKFKEKSWLRFIDALGIGDPKEKYTEEDRRRDIAKSNCVVERVKRAIYERVV